MLHEARPGNKHTLHEREDQKYKVCRQYKEQDAVRPKTTIYMCRDKKKNGGGGGFSSTCLWTKKNGGGGGFSSTCLWSVCTIHTSWPRTTAVCLPGPHGLHLEALTEILTSDVSPLTCSFENQPIHEREDQKYKVCRQYKEQDAVRPKTTINMCRVCSVPIDVKCLPGTPEENAAQLSHTRNQY
ncbi:hypothetical protein ElyMa_004696800 [Elysia marginata]|uniref:Uncharacterized protein n=1 Tax=Elysia marginata TaxID=1093978 RepID=A0AAV4I7W0_9GAST|nr:hypothetical protein ElyMa_004696800 [Elysia marginata]